MGRLSDKEYDAIVYGIVDSIEYHEDYDEWFAYIYSEDLEKEPYDFYQGQVIFEPLSDKEVALDLHEGDKVKMGVILTDDPYEQEDIVDILEKVSSGSIGASSNISAATKPKLCFLKEDRSGYVSRKPTIWVGTIDYLVRAFSYTLEVGQSWEYERGNHKINRNPKNINSLVKNLQWAKDNAARNGYSGTYYDALSIEDLDNYDDENARWAGEINGERIFRKPTPEQLGL